ncbi:MAG: DNA mismatch repair endonuclease MutL [Cryomorphaceae bacterium]|jgi:DNA mismatch repair protein MutL|nr:DNA mismatch repair endonuclease MutL [Cryomorphaceae bacterium]MBT3502928.1 DNA mismatch repair endonuclease MutL [Cryomorphaceae bacterium]MBT3688703.1 DNA mismatch repair endonuclease MutL [Cryomorphaceae bacterium]MBT4222589.1 DNA mismatch repair endonuclease MutL [Cryomorphaceae bacterium]MBT4292980.1 DNA mismatch repair endonuclease MutL [Cryomorphaceae bacterium]
MSDIVKILPIEVSNKIAAGEVVQRPSSVLKELLENSIDANSTKIKVIIKNAGKNLIQVIDDGDGMSIKDMHSSFIKHATSKINSIDDVFSISSMGFRGEALAAISSVSMVEMSSSKVLENDGYFIEINGGKIIKEKESNFDKGTSIKVKNIFFNVPARRNFLKSDFVELRHIMNVFHNIAVSHNEIEFSFINNDEEIFYLKKESLKKRIISIFGEKIREHLIPIKENTQIANLNGYVLKPEYAKKSRSNQFIFVNNRSIKSQFINHSISSSFDGLLREGYFPGYFLFINMNPLKIDVNVHPNKTEIKFDDDQSLYSIINSSVKHCLGIYQISPVLDFEKDQSMDISYTQINENPKIPTIEVDSEFNPFKIFNEESFIKKDSDIALSNNPSDIIQDNNKSSKIFQIFNKYIVSTSTSSLIIINQNLAHQRILYEGFLKSIFESSSESQKLVFPIEIMLTKPQLILFKKIITEFDSMGFVYKLSDSLLTIISVPVQLENNSIEELIDDILDDENDFDKSKNLSYSDFFAKKLSKCSAIKTGKNLNSDEQEFLVNQLFSCKEPNLSPDNKQIFITLNKNDIENRF